MCLAVPGKVVRFEDDGSELRMATVDFGGVLRKVSLAPVPEARIGDYVIVHVGFAIARLDEAEALQTIRDIEEISRAAEQEPA